MDDGLRKILEEKIEKAGDDVKGAILEWGSACPSGSGETLGDILESQVRHQARQRKMTVQEFVDFLFELPNSETFLLRLQA